MSERPFEPPDTDELAGLEDLSPDDPRVIAQGPRVRAQLRAYRDFVAPDTLPEGARADDAEERLGRMLERELGIPASQPSAARAETPRIPVASEPQGFWTRLLGPRMRPAIGFAAVLVVLGVVWMVRPRPAQEPVLRGTQTPASPTELASATVTRSDGSVRLEWLAVAGASSYRVVFLSPDLSEIARVNDLHDTRFDLIDGSLPSGLTPHAPVLWRVHAMSGGDELARSKTISITTP